MVFLVVSLTLMHLIKLSFRLTCLLPQVRQIVAKNGKNLANTKYNILKLLYTTYGIANVVTEF